MLEASAKVSEQLPGIAWGCQNNLLMFEKLISVFYVIARTLRGFSRRSNLKAQFSRKFD